MAYKVFLSHSTKDERTIRSIIKLLQQRGLEVFVAEWHINPGADLTSNIMNSIRSSHCVLALLTKNGVRSTWVNQEIGYALGLKKLVIPLVEKGTDVNQLGALQRLKYVEFQEGMQQDSFIYLANYLNTLKIAKEDQEKWLWTIGLGVLVLASIFSGKK